MSNPPSGPSPDENEFDRRVADTVESRLTEERLAKQWDVWRGASTQETARTSGKQTWKDLLTLLWNTRVLPVAIGATAILIGWAVLTGDELTLRTPNASAGNFRLPDTLRIRLGSAKGSLSGKSTTAFILILGGGSRSGGDITTRDLEFSGTTETGTELKFRGTLLLTNAPGVVEIKSQRDVLGGWISGELIMGTNLPVHIEQPYLRR